LNLAGFVNPGLTWFAITLKMPVQSVVCVAWKNCSLRARTVPVTYAAAWAGAETYPA